MSAVSCAVGCGACCDPVLLPMPLKDMTRWSAVAVAGYPDPADDEGWKTWQAVGWADEHRQYVIDGMSPERDRRNADFAAEHWTQLYGPETESRQGGSRVVCDAFDRHTRSCTVHAEGGQPPICSWYPHYGRKPGDPAIAYGAGMDPACSFNAEVRTMLPIVEVR